MDLRQLRYFLTVAQEGSFSRAAASLHMTQPPLSLAVSQLEKEMGIRLLERHSHGVRTTAAGEYLVEAGAQLLQRTARIEQHLLDLGRGIRGRLRVAAVPTFSWTYLPPLLQKYAQIAANVEVELSDPAPQDVLSLVASGIADIGFVATGNTEQLRRFHESELHVELAHPMPLAAALPRRLRDAPDPVDLRSLLDERWIVPARIPGFPGLIELIEAVWADLECSPQVHVVSTLQTAVPLVVAEMGVSIMPGSITEITNDSLVIRRTLQVIRPLEAAVVWSRSQTPTPALRRFLELVLPGPALDRLG